MMERVEASRAPWILAVGSAGLLALFLALEPIQYVVMALAAVGVVVLVLLNRHAALYVSVLAIALSPDINVGVALRADDFIMVALTLAWLIRLCVFKERQGTVLDRLLIAYVLVAFAATLWGLHLGTAYLTTDKYSSAPFHVLKRVEFVFLFFIFTDTLRTLQEVRRFTYTLMVALLALSVYSLWVFLSNGRIALAPPGAPVHEPGIAAMLNIALALSLLPAATRPAKVALGLIIAFSLAVLPLAFGRNFISSTVLVLLYMGLFQQRWVLALIPLPFIMWLAYPAAVVQRILTLSNVLAPDVTGFQTHGAAILSRTIWPSHYALLTLGYSPILGFGLANQPLGAVDSEYIIQILYTGLVGFAIFLMLGARLFRLVREARRAARSPLDVALANSFQLILVAFAVFSIFSASISAQRAGGFFFILVGLIAVFHRALTQPAAEAPPDRRP